MTLVKITIEDIRIHLFCMEIFSFPKRFAIITIKNVYGQIMHSLVRHSFVFFFHLVEPHVFMYVVN
jgi:hypothetical protein